MELVKQVLDKHGFPHHGFTELKAPLTLSFYKSWLDKDYHGDMKYLREHVERKENPTLLLPKARSAIVVTHPYGGGNSASTFSLKANKVAAYAQDTDYHFWLKEKLERVCQDLKAAFPEHEFLSFTDSAPVLERDLAHRAGLGWFGKNTCLLDKKRGSLFLIAEIYTSLSLTGSVALPTDHCGTCTRCIDACPTGAIEPLKTLNATRCISYWTIESRDVPPENLRDQFSGWLFGCDICQTVCPWNIKAFQIKEEPATDLSAVSEELAMIFSSSHKELERRFQGTPLARTGGRGLKRNALIVAANLKLTQLAPQIATMTEDPRLGDLARWTLDRLAIS